VNDGISEDDRTTKSTEKNDSLRLEGRGYLTGRRREGIGGK